MNNPKVGFVSLGCPKALVDSERILTQLRLDGYDLVQTYDDAEVVVVNTCGFIDSARMESLDTIGEAMKKNGKVIVTGCMGVHEDDIRQSHPDVLSVSGPQQYEQVVRAVHEHAPIESSHNPYIDLVPESGIKLTPRHYAYLKISEGCNHKCSFCIIPSLRGKLVSRRIDDVMREAEGLVRNGVRELLIISQDTSAYGVDIKHESASVRGVEYETSFKGLCAALSTLGVWVRMHYVYPYRHVDNIIPFMAEGKVLPYLDIPFQHSSPRILKAMRRPAAMEDNLRRIESWRTICPDIALRSTFIVGFPGETEEDFEHLLDFIEEAKLDRVGCFQYSDVEGARANELDNPVPEDVKADRWDHFMQIQARVSSAKLKEKIGQTLKVIVDEVSDGQIIARSYADAPEIDGNVILQDDGSIKPGDIVDAVIESSNTYDLYAIRTNNII